MSKTPCPHCGKPYRTFLESAYRMVDKDADKPGTVRQFYALASKYRCMSCGKTFVTED
jgi:transposase-like protein